MLKILEDHLQLICPIFKNFLHHFPGPKNAQKHHFANHTETIKAWNLHLRNFLHLSFEHVSDINFLYLLRDTGKVTITRTMISSN